MKTGYLEYSKREKNVLNGEEVGEIVFVSVKAEEISYIAASIRVVVPFRFQFPLKKLFRSIGFLIVEENKVFNSAFKVKNSNSSKCGFRINADCLFSLEMLF